MGPARGHAENPQSHMPVSDNRASAGKALHSIKSPLLARGIDKGRLSQEEAAMQEQRTRILEAGDDPDAFGTHRLFQRPAAVGIEHTTGGKSSFVG